MANTAFSTASTTEIALQPTAATKIILRSASASDTQNASVYGTVSAAPDSETNALTGQIEIETTAEFTALTQAILATAAVGAVVGLAEGTAAVGDVRVDVIPSDGDTLTIGLTGSTRAYRWKNTMASPYDVKIGASLSDCAANLKAAINADGTPGVEYYAGTAANPYLSASVSTAVVTLTDRIPCERQLAWVLTESASNFSKRAPSNGVDGSTLFTIPAGQTTAALSLTFSTEDHTTETLPALMLGTSTPIAIGGYPAMIRIWSDQAITVKFQTSTDSTNWHDTSEGNQSISASSMTYLTLAELAEYLRMVIVTNSNTTDTILDARVIY